MNRICICVVNYNQKDFVIECVQSVINSTYMDFDFYFIDNNSTDGSVDAVKAKFDDKLSYIVNDENKGSSGGFNTGLKLAVEKGYEYVMLLDHDVVLDKYAISHMVEYADLHDEVSVVAGMMLWYDNPGIVQIYGTNIDFESYKIKDVYKGAIFNSNLPDVVTCEFVPTGISLIRTSDIKTIGYIDESFFIYMDDVDWYLRFTKAGRIVRTIKKAFVYHHSGAKVAETSFPTYMYWRNRIMFFAKHLDRDKIEDFCKVYLKELFQATYSCLYLNKISTIKTLMLAYDDGMNGISGKPKDSRIFKRDKVGDEATEFINKYSDFFIIVSEEMIALRKILDKIKSVNPSSSITLLCSEQKSESLQQQYPELTVLSEPYNRNENAVVLEICKHVFSVKERNASHVYVDEYINLIVTDEDWDYCRNSDKAYKYFYETQFPVLFQKMSELWEARREN